MTLTELYYKERKIIIEKDCSKYDDSVNSEEEMIKKLSKRLESYDKNDKTYKKIKDSIKKHEDRIKKYNKKKQNCEKLEKMKQKAKDLAVKGTSTLKNAAIDWVNTQNEK